MIAPVAGFHADDRHDYFGRHAGLRRHLVQLRAILGVEIAALPDARLGQEDRAIVLPRLAFGRPGDGVDDALLVARLRQPGANFRRRHATFACRLGDECGFLFRGQDRRRACLCRLRRDRGRRGRNRDRRCRRRRGRGGQARLHRLGTANHEGQQEENGNSQRKAHRAEDFQDLAHNVSRGNRPTIHAGNSRRRPDRVSKK